MSVADERDSGSQKSLVFTMSADPEPSENVSLTECKGAMRVCHASRPEFADWLELQGRMSRIVIEKIELLVGALA